jgi:soluble P-type ATPase
MIEIAISELQKYNIDYLVIDFNGTVACDGVLPDKIRLLLRKLSNCLSIYVLTSDTFGTAEKQLRNSVCQLQIIPEQDQAAYKEEFIRKLGAGRTATVGNGVNDHLMLKSAAIGIGVIMPSANIQLSVN